MNTIEDKKELKILADYDLIIDNNIHVGIVLSTNSIKN